MTVKEESEKVGLKLNIQKTKIMAAAAAQSLQSCPTLCDPIDGSPPGSLVPGILQARTVASNPITSWQIDGGTMETVRDFIFWGSKITADGDCSHEIKRCLFLGRKAINNLDCILKSRDIVLPTKRSV